MILIDTNLLLYARLHSFPQHSRAHAWLDACLNGDAPVALPWEVLLGFLRIVTNRRVLENPLPTEVAWRQVTEWLDCRPVWVPVPGERHAAIVGTLLLRTQAAANLVPDAHLAALAIENGLQICSSDGDFARFPGLRWRNPLLDVVP